MSTPTKLPAGWRYLRKGETIDTGDKCDDRSGGFIPVRLIGVRVALPKTFIRPVRDAKPAKKATKKATKKKAKRVKVRARVMFTCGEDNATVPIGRARYYSGPHPVSPVLVIPFDAASREAIVETAAQKVADHTQGVNCVPSGKSIDLAHLVLATLHPDFAKEGR